MNEKVPKLILLVVVLIIFLLTLGVLVYYIRYSTSTNSKASGYNTVNTVSVSNSYVFASPIRAKAGGDLIRITVFLLDDSGIGVFGKKVNLKATDAILNIKETQSLTDQTGKAVFDIASTSVGTFTLEASTSEEILPQKVKLIFD